MAAAFVAPPNTDAELLRQTQRRLNKLIDAKLLDASPVNTQGIPDRNTVLGCQRFRDLYALDDPQGLHPFLSGVSAGIPAALPPALQHVRLGPAFLRNSPDSYDLPRDLEPKGVFARVLQYLVDHSEGTISVMSEEGVRKLAKVMVPAAPHANIQAYTTKIRDAFVREMGGDNTGMLLMAFATIRVETKIFKPLDEFENWGNSKSHPGANAVNNSAYQAFDVYGPKSDNLTPEQQKQRDQEKVAGGIMRQKKDWPAPIRQPGEKGSSLGNTDLSDGARFKGRGFVQLTGKANYTEAGRSLHVDLVGHPELVTSDPDVSAKALVWYLLQSTPSLKHPGHKERLRAALVTHDVKAMRAIVNGGTTGWEEFQESYWAGKRYLNTSAFAFLQGRRKLGRRQG